VSSLIKNIYENELSGNSRTKQTKDLWFLSEQSELLGTANIQYFRSHSCALLTDSTVKCWGGNGYGQLGDGTTTVRWTPLYYVSGITTATRNAIRYWHSCALLADGKVMCLGAGNRRLGDGTAYDRHKPVAVSGITIATSIALGRVQSCAVLVGGKVK